jgi:EmrB/QacA subfamily drug resistance transporter
MDNIANPVSGEPISEPVSSFRKWAPLFVLAMALAIIIIDTTVLNVSLRNIITDLHTDIHKIQWVITSYSLILAAFTITGGRLGDLYGRKRMFIIGAIIFAIGSIVTALSNSVGMILVGNAVIEGIGACLMMPATAALLLTTYQGRDRSLAFGVWGGIIAASAAVGPILGGWLTKEYSWRWAFGINPIVVVVLLIGTVLIKEAYETKHRPTIDIGGVILSSLGLLSLAFGFIQASVFGWFKTKEQLMLFNHTLNLGDLSATPLFILLGLILLAIFIWYEKRVADSGKTPLVSLGIFKNRAFVVGVVVTSVLALGQTGVFFSIPVFLQAVRNLDPLQTGLAMLPMPLAILVGAPLSAKINSFISPKRLIQLGLLISILGLGILYAALNVDVSAWGLAPGFAVFGFGMGLIFAQVGNVTLSAVELSEAGEASGINNTSRQIGATLGAAVMGAILLSTLSTNLVSGVEKSDVIPEASKQSISEAVEKNSSAVEFGSTSEIGNGTILPENIANEIRTISHEATTDANKVVMIYGGIFLFLAFLLSFLLPKEVKEARTLTNDAMDVPVQSIDEIAVQHAEKYAITPAVVPVEPTPIEKPRALNRTTVSIAAAMIVLGAIAAFIILNDNKDDSGSSNTNERVEIVDQADVPVNAPTTNEGSTSEPSSTSPSTPQEIPSETPLTAADASGLKIYSNSGLQFEVVVPEDWVITDNDNEIIFKTADDTRYNIQMYAAPNSDAVSFKEFLMYQPNMHTVLETNIVGHEGFTFMIDGIYKYGYAFLDNGRIYYILGEGIKNSPIGQSFKTL